MPDGAEFGAAAMLEVSVDERSLAEAKAQIQEELGNVQVGVGADDGAAGALRGGDDAGVLADGGVDYLESIADYSEEQVELLEEIEDGLGGVGGGGDGGTTIIPTSGGQTAAKAAKFAVQAAAAVGGAGLLVEAQRRFFENAKPSGITTSDMLGQLGLPGLLAGSGRSGPKGGVEGGQKGGRTPTELALAGLTGIGTAAFGRDLTQKEARNRLAALPFGDQVLKQLGMTAPGTTDASKGTPTLNTKGGGRAGNVGVVDVGPSAESTSGRGQSGTGNRGTEKRQQRSTTNIDITVNVEGSTKREVEKAMEQAKKEVLQELNRQLQSGPRVTLS